MRTRVHSLPAPWLRDRAWEITAQWRLCLVAIGAGAAVATLVLAYLWLGAGIALYRQEVARATLSVEHLRRDVLYLEHQVELALRRDQILQRAGALGMAEYDKDRIIDLTRNR